MWEWMFSMWGWIVWAFTTQFANTLIATAIGALAGTLAGMFGVYLVQSKSVRSAEMRKNISVARRAQYAFISRYEFLINMDRQFLQEVRATPPDKLNLFRFDHRWNGPRVEMESLEFMVPHSAEAFHSLDYKNKQFDSLIIEIDQRNEHMESITGDRHASGIASFSVAREFYKEIQHRNSELIAAFDSANDKFLELMEEFREALIKIYPKGSFLKFEPKKPETTPAADSSLAQPTDQKTD